MRRTVLLLSVVGAMLMMYAGTALATHIPPDLAVEYHQGPSKASPGQTDLGYYAQITNKGGRTATVPNGTVIAKQTLTGTTATYCSAPSGYECRGVGTGTLEVVAVGDQAIGVGQSFYVQAYATAPTTGKLTHSVAADPNGAIEETDETNNASGTIATYVGTPPPTDLSVTQTDNADPIDIGRQLGYTVKVTNNGQDTAFNVSVDDLLPGNVTYDFAAAPQGSCNYIASENVVICPMGDIVSGASKEFTLYVSTKAAGTITNTATVYSDYGDPEPANDTSKQETVVKPPPDYEPPNTNITSGPSGTVKSTSASFAFSSTEAGSKFECSLDYAAFSACASPKAYSGLASKTHTFRVRAVDAAGNRDGTPATRTWTADTVLPTVSGMLPKPASVTTDITPTIRAIVRDNLTNLQKANMKLYVNGVLISPTKYSYSASTDVLTYNSPKVAKGKKTVRIVATDAAKNVRTTSWSFTIK